MNNAHLAVIMTCHNRCNITLTCLYALHQQEILFDVYLTDDGSSDGTSHTIITAYPQVNILQGNGDLYWVGGMRLAFTKAIERGYKYYLWLNDDTILEIDSLKRLIVAHEELSKNGYSNSIVVGSTKDPITGKATYGGAVRSKNWYSNKFEFIQPSDSLLPCDTMYGNCVLIPSSVVKKVGNIDAAFIHTFGDLDYGLRAGKLGCSIWVLPGFIGSCSKNPIDNTWADTNLSWLQRLRKVTQIKEFPFKAWTIFCIRHSGVFWFIYWFLPYLRATVGYKNLTTSTFTKNIN